MRAKEKLLTIVVLTWEDEKGPESSVFFAKWLEEISMDFRVREHDFFLILNCTLCNEIADYD